MAYQSINPFNGKTLRTFEETTNEALEEAVGTAATFYETWRHKSFAERAVIVAGVASLMQQKVEVMEGGPSKATYVRWNRYVY